MTKFNSKIIVARDGTQVHFVGRARSKPFTDEEVAEYLEEHGLSVREFETPENWEPANTKVFLSDLRFGLDFCANKYGISVPALEAYIRRAAPHVNLRIYGEKDG